MNNMENFCLLNFGIKEITDNTNTKIDLKLVEEKLKVDWDLLQFFTLFSFFCELFINEIQKKITIRSNDY